MRMARGYRAVSFVFASIFLASCASGPPLKPVPAEKVSETSARIQIARTTDMLYLALDARVSVNGSVVAALPRGGSTYVDVNPGTATVRVDHPTSPGSFAVSFEARPGSTYAIEVSPRNESFMPGALGGVIGLAVDASITENSGLFMIKLVSSEDQGKSNVQRSGPSSTSSNGTVEERLKHLRKLREDGLIDADVYTEQQKRILSE